MSIYYIMAADGSVYELDATTGVTYSEACSISTHKMEDGSVVADHVVNEPVRISFEGIITDIKLVTSDRTKDTNSWIDGIKSLKDNEQLFTTIWREDVGTQSSNSSSIYRVPNCLFRSLSIVQDQQHGYAFGKHAYRISIEIEQIRIAQRAAISVDKTFALELRDKASDLSDSSGTTESIEGPQSSQIVTKIYGTLIKSALIVPRTIGNTLGGDF